MAKDKEPATPEQQAAEIERLRAENARLQKVADRVADIERENDDLAAQLEKQRAVALGTTTTKPVWAFTVKGPRGTLDTDATDESEAARLYWVHYKSQPDPSAKLIITCVEPERQASILKQHRGSEAFQKLPADQRQHIESVVTKAPVGESVSEPVRPPQVNIV